MVNLGVARYVKDVLMLKSNLSNIIIINSCSGLHLFMYTDKYILQKSYEAVLLGIWKLKGQLAAF